MLSVYATISPGFISSTTDPRSFPFTVWESYEHHEKLMNDKATYPKLTGSVEAVFDKSKGPTTMLHVNTTNEPYKAFEAPVVEIALFTLHEGKSKSELEGLVKTLADAVNTKAGTDGVFHASWGLVREKENVVALFIGWTSVDVCSLSVSIRHPILISACRTQAHWDLVKSDPGAIEIIGKCKAISDIAMAHVPLALY